MKTLILYATKYGAAGEIASRIASRINGAVTHDMKQSGFPPLTGFDCVIIGSSVYAGSIRKEAKAFLKQNAQALQSKKLGLFLCGLDASKENECFTDNFPDDIIKAAKAKAFLGGVYDPKKAGFAERLIMKAVTKHSEYKDAIDDKKIEQFTSDMKK